MFNKVLFLNDTSCSYHYGCYGTSLYIKEQILKRTNNLICRSVLQTHSTQNVPFEIGGGADGRIQINRNIEFEIFKNTNQSLIKDIENCSCVIVNGEGTIHDFHNAPRALLYTIYVAKTFYNKKVILINHSCFINSKEKNVKKFYKLAYKCCDYVAVREKMSQKKLRKIGINSVLAFDSLPLKIKQDYNNITNFNEKYILFSGGVNFKLNVIKYIVRFIKIFYKNYNYYFLTGKEPYVDGDLSVYNEMKKYFPELQLKQVDNFYDWLGYIKNCKLLISGRFHYEIAAMSFGKKSIAFESNTKKITAIRKLFSLSKAISYKHKYLFKIKLFFALLEIKVFKKVKNNFDKICSLAENNYNW